MRWVTSRRRACGTEPGPGPGHGPGRPADHRRAGRRAAAAPGAAAPGRGLGRPGPVRARAPGRVHRAGRDRGTDVDARRRPVRPAARRRRLAAVRRHHPHPARPARRRHPGRVVSNIGFDLRAAPRRAGASPAWSTRSCCPTRWAAASRTRRSSGRRARRCGTDPERTLMVGDSPADAGAAAAGCSVLVLPESDPGKVHGLSAVLRLLAKFRCAAGKPLSQHRLCACRLPARRRQCRNTDR